MPRLFFTQQLARFISVPEVNSTALTLRAALDEAFVGNPQLRGYVLDDQGHVRMNVVIFVDGIRVAERQKLEQVLQAESQVYVLQALSGG